jgi:hypothetical protein
MTERFEDQLLDALAGEVQSRSYGPHLTVREMRRLQRGRTRVTELERLGGHLATCAECRSRYDAVRRGIAVGTDSRATRRLHPPSGAARIILRHAGVAALALSIVAVTLAMAGRPGARETLNVPAIGARSAASQAPAPGHSTLLDAQTLVRALHAFDGYPPSRAAAYTIGLLREYGIPLSSDVLAFRAATVVVTEPGDTWESVAERALGDPALWPMVVLLNMEKTESGEFVPPGTYLRVPQPLSSEESQ